jgi:hypothetical protein
MTTSTTPDADYAFWTIPGTSSKVTYSLGTFHEIDFVVNEGFRRIPHGGIEMGGLLFGRMDGDGVRIEMFRPIECEHASGPSFNLSDRDISNLEMQISSAASDPEIGGLEVVGWFIAHTRGPLKMTERETQLFDRLFPGPGKLTVLVKPERFHPTRFGFLIREKERRFGTDATGSAVILPGRSSQGREGPVPSIAAPPESSEARRADRNSATDTPTRPAFAAREPHKGPREPQNESRESPHSSSPSTSSSAGLDPSPAEAMARTGPENAKLPAAERSAPLPARLPNIPEAEFPPGRPRSTTFDQERKAYGVQFALVLLLAAVLGCCVGYWAYLQLPSAIIPLVVQRQQTTLLISWPPAQTRTSAYAAIRVDDGEPVALSSAEKIAGHAAIANSSTNVKIELIAQHWLRDSRGIVRFVSAEQPNSPANSGVSAAPSQLP